MITKGKDIGFSDLNIITQKDEVTFEFFNCFHTDINIWIKNNNYNIYTTIINEQKTHILDITIITFPNKELATLFKLKWM